MLRGHRTFAFRWWLPITELVLCVAVLWPVLPALKGQVRESIHAYRAKRNPLPDVPENQRLIVPFSTQEQLDFETRERLKAREWIPQMLNLPSGLVQLLPYVILNPTKHEWIPRGMTFRLWRAISWPVVGILFWWIAGRGIEGLLAARQRLIRPRITWIETITGAALFTFCAVAAVCMPLFSGSDEHFFMSIFVAASLMWSAIGGAVVAGRVAQWRLRKRLIGGAQELSPAPTT